MNWYAYVGNDPVNNVDPTGNVTTDVQVLRNIGINGQGFSTFRSAQGDAFNEASGINDVKNAIKAAMNGDFSGVLQSAVLVACKGCKIATKASKLQQMKRRNQTPAGIKRFDSSEKDVPKSQDHVHFDDGTSLNVDGSIHDKKNGVPKLTNKQEKFLNKNNWTTTVGSRIKRKSK